MNKRKHDIERYLRGEMTGAEMHALEKEALKDPFLSEALEGIDQAGAEKFLFDLKQLHHSVHQRTRTRKPKVISMWNWSLGIAAGLIIIAVSAVFIISSILDQNRTPLATAESPSKPENPSQSPPTADPLPATPVEPAAIDTPTAGAQRPRRAAATGVLQDRAAGEETAVPQEDPAAAPSIAQSGQVESPDSTRGLLADSPAGTREIASAPATGIDGTQPLSRDTTWFVTGKVTSAEDDTPLPGVTVSVKGTGVAGITDREGNYRINLMGPRQSLVFYFIGMERREVTPGDRKHVDVQLDADVSQLSELVVIGYDNGPDGHPAVELAAPEGGPVAFEEYVEGELQYPAQALLNNVEGRVTIEFTVGADGHLRDFQVLKGLGYGIDDEAIRLVKEGPAWSPSKRHTQPVPEKVKIRLKFAIPKKQ